MSYGLKRALRLYGRDLVFLARYLLGKIRSGSGEGAVVLCNSYPKSGTHLLYQILCAVPGLKPWNDIVSIKSLSGVMNTASHIRWKLGSAPPGSVIRSHLMCHEEVLGILRERNCKRFFIYRDLRDTALSHARWVHVAERAFLHAIYRYHFKTDDQRLMASIEGTPVGSPFGSNVSHPSIGQDFARWKGWLYDADTLAVRFEDLVGSRGGGDDEARWKTIRQILEHLEVETGREEIESRFSFSALDPQESHTFRKGMIGGWKEAFKQEHKEAFKRAAGDLLIELGYEEDDNW